MLENRVLKIMVLMVAAIQFTIGTTEEPHYHDSSDVAVKICSLLKEESSEQSPAIIALCESESSKASAKQEYKCIPLPSRPAAKDDYQIPLSKRLASGVKEKILNSSSSSRGIFMVGLTGAGKTTLSQILNGNLSRLQATKTRSGEIVIIDEDSKIGPPTTLSKTLIPEHIVNPDSNLSFWDCPGFDDTRGSDLVIETMYFLHRTLEQVSQAKFIFVVTHSSVKIGNDRLEFDRLVTHAIHLLKDISKFERSIAMVVTKVSSYSSAGNYLSDDDILLQITEFLEVYVETMTAQSQAVANETDKTTFHTKIQFVHTLLNSNDRPIVAPYIYIVRTPEHCGPLQEVPSILTTRKKITELYTRLAYSHISPKDIGISVNAETEQQIVTKHIPQVVQNIGEIVERISTKLLQRFLADFSLQLRKEEGEHTPKIPLRLPRNTSEIVDAFVEKFRTVTGLGHHGDHYHSLAFSNQLSKLLTVLKVEAEECLISTINELEQQFNFFEMAAGKQQGQPDPSWLQPLTNSSTDMKKHKEFMEYSHHLKKKVTEEYFNEDC